MNLAVNFAGVSMKNPVTTASGTFGSGAEYGEYVDLNRLGAVTTKGVANVPWPGNPTPRVCETYGGMLNAIGLQNPGIDVFIERDIPYLKQYDTNIIVNVCGKTPDEYIDVVRRLAEEDVALLEINISCPNVKAGGIAFGQDPKQVEKITSQIKAVAKQQKLGLSQEELAFYDALTKPEHIKDFYKNDELIALTRELTEMLRKNRTIDWQKKETARAQMRKMVKRLLKKYKYPPEDYAFAISTVISQCELWTDNNVEPRKEEKLYKYVSEIELSKVAEDTVPYGEK